MKRCFLLPLLLLPFAGCDARIDRFESNGVYALALDRSRQTPTETALADSAQVVSQIFGTPDQPRWPAHSAGAGLVDPANLTRAAGPVSSDRDGLNHGLYRKHCVNCHGLNGSGAGPASLFQNPYPRDFRHGVFKWKSTPRAAKPTRDDLRALLERGVAGTGMPSFRLLDAADLEALVDYVIFLSVRGEVERSLLAAAVDELGYEATSPEEVYRLTSFGAEATTEAGRLVEETIAEVLGEWRDALESRLEVEPMPELSAGAFAESVARGQQIFHGPVANCAGCHGPAGNGQLVTLDYDDWTKEYSTRIGLTPSDSEAMRPFRDRGALPPQQIKPRKLSDGVFRGPGDAQSLMRIISQGIAGTPMPAVSIGDGSATALTIDQVWDLVRYVQSLGNQDSGEHESKALR